MAKGAQAPKRLLGVQFPAGRSNERNSTDAVKAVLRASASVADAAAAEGIDAERNWRYRYNVHLVKNCELLARGPASQSVAIAAAGLQALHSTFEFVDAAGQVETLAAAMARVPGLVADAGGFDCGIIVGSRAASPPGPFQVPYNGRTLEGESLRQQLHMWLQRGIIERDACQALGGLSESNTDLAGRTFVCIGASSEMGPTGTLLAHGATVLALDVPRPEAWQTLAQLASASRGTLVVPLRRSPDSAGGARTCTVGQGLTEQEFCSLAGCNILEETPAVAAWICAHAGEGPLCVGSYVYLDGANFVRVSLAADAISEAVCRALPDAALACMSSPSECYEIPAEVFAKAAERLQSPPAGKLHRLWYTPLRLASGGKYCVPVVPAATVDTGKGVVLLRDSYAHMQGPNYAFAKHIQRWRMLLARSQGHVVSANLGPMTLTRSILSNSLIAAGVKGAVHFGLEPFYAPTSSALLAMLLVHDLTDKASAANPDVELSTPLQLFSENALHVGAWHAAFTANSFTGVCALTYAAGKAQPYVAVGLASAAAAAAWRVRSRL